nr:SusC/RagA family TonB-linked outer membrane protein [Bacteroidales bacterium]
MSIKSRKTWLTVGMSALLVGGTPGFMGTGLSSTAYAQNTKKITGTVVDETGEPVIGANIRVQGTNKGATTDIEGRFSIDANSSQKLEISFIGYATQVVDATPNLTVTLSEDFNSLEDVVVIGYGVQKKKLLTGATAQVKGDDIAKLNTSNPLQAMQGQTPGMSVVSNSGQPGEGMSVKIRGLGTIGSGSPLYIIDGIGGDISTVNPADIESIDVLKDAASAAIYGAQAANGVVLVTTKSGREGKATISFDSYWGIQNVARTVDMLNAREYMAIMNEQQINDGQLPYDFSSFKSIYDANGNLIDTDWLDQMFKDDAKTSSYSLGITGGNQVSTYAMSLAYMNQEGIVGGKDVSNYERYNFRINSEHKVIRDLLSVGEQVSYVYAKKVGIGVGNQYNNTLRGAFGTSPLTPVYSDNNTYDSPYNATDGSDWYAYDGNPYGAMMTKTNNESATSTINANAYAQLTPLKGLKIRSVFGIVYSSNDYRSFTPLYHFSPYDYNDPRTSVSQSASHGLGMTWTNTAQYDWKMDDHNLSALVGMEAYRYQ